MGSFFCCGNLLDGSWPVLGTLQKVLELGFFTNFKICSRPQKMFGISIFSWNFYKFMFCPNFLKMFLLAKFVQRFKNYSCYIKCLGISIFKICSQIQKIVYLKNVSDFQILIEISEMFVISKEVLVF